ncbi:MAG: AraC family transcriptional regulator [Gammaproteobacteria bacterium]|jgi:predicted transcriptional regulator YdeE|nr:AraC family transcriptional regulator [Gammaproteobacteria bacterium]
MLHRTTRKAAFNVIGITCRTSNAAGKAEKDIPVLWEKLMNDNFLLKIPKRVNEGIYCVYTNYEKDETGDYTVLLGAASIDTETALPEGMIRHHLPESDYICLPVKGDYPLSLVRTWQWVWKNDLPRAYTADFEYYPEGMKNLKEPVLDVYIAVKEEV